VSGGVRELEQERQRRVKVARQSGRSLVLLAEKAHVGSKLRCNTRGGAIRGKIRVWPPTSR